MTKQEQIDQLRQEIEALRADVTWLRAMQSQRLGSSYPNWPPYQYPTITWCSAEGNSNGMIFNA